MTISVGFQQMHLVTLLTVHKCSAGYLSQNSPPPPYVLTLTNALKLVYIPHIKPKLPGFLVRFKALGSSKVCNVKSIFWHSILYCKQLPSKFNSLFLNIVKDKFSIFNDYSDSLFSWFDCVFDYIFMIQKESSCKSLLGLCIKFI